MADSDSGRRVLVRTEQLFSSEKAVGTEQKEAIFKGLFRENDEREL